MASMSSAAYNAKSTQIRLNYQKAMQQASELENIARDVENVSDSQMQECLNQIVTSWEGENSKAYVNKGRIIQTRVKNLARELRNAADTIRDTANVIRNAELRNLEIASRRSF